MIRADRLREAARVLRERAEAATPGPWRFTDSEAAYDVWEAGLAVVNLDSDPIALVADEWYENDPGEPAPINDAQWITTMHPSVGLALADWLECQADTTCDCGVDESALVLADLVLGGASRPARRTGPMSAAHIDADPSRRPALEKCSSCGHECGYHFTPDGRTIPCDAEDLSPVRDCGCEQYTYLAENDADLILGSAP